MLAERHCSNIKSTSMKARASVFKARSEALRGPKDDAGAAAPEQEYNREASKKWIPRQSCSSNPSPAAVLFGEGRVVERNGTHVAALGSISLTPPHDIPVPHKVPMTGFPSVMRRADIGVRRATHLPGSDSCARTEGKQEEIPDRLEHDQVRSQNRAAVLSMRPEEVELAIQELGMHLSPESLAFLGRRGEKELEMERDGTAKTIESILNIEGDRTATLVSSVSKNSLDVHFEGSRMSPIVDSNINSLPAIGNVREPLKCAPIECFDIDGKKLVVRSDFISQFTDIVCSDSLYSGLLNSNPLLQQGIEDIACSIFDTCVSIGFCVESIAFGAEVSSGVDVQFGDLRFDDLESGAEITSFSLPKACAFMRASVSSKRRLGMRVLCGTLQRRELLVSVEAYGPDLVEHFQESSLSTLSDMDLNFGKGFENCVGSLVGCLLPHMTGGSATRLCGGGMWASSMAQVAAIRVRRLLVYALMRLCASDFPPELAYVQHANVKHKSLDISTRLSLSHLLKAYLTSSLEELAAEHIWTIPSWSMIGTPAFLIPHARRSELAYGDHARMSERKWRSRVSSGSEIQNHANVVEEFALLYRWNRLAAALSHQGPNCMLEDLIQTVINGASMWARAQKSIVDWNKEGKLVDKEFLEGLKNEYLSYIEISIPVIDIFAAAARAFIQNIDWLRRFLVPLVSSTGGKGASPLLNPTSAELHLKSILYLSHKESELLFSSSIAKSLSTFKEKVWKLFAEISRSENGVDVHRWMCSAAVGIIGSVSAATSQFIYSVRRATDPCFLWGLRCWRMCLLRGVGIDTAEGLLLLCNDDFWIKDSILSAINLAKSIGSEEFVMKRVIAELLDLIQTLCGTVAAIIRNFFSKTSFPLERVQDVARNIYEAEFDEADSVEFIIDDTVTFDRRDLELSLSIARQLVIFSRKLLWNDCILGAIATLNPGQPRNPVIWAIRGVLAQTLGSHQQFRASGRFGAFLNSVHSSGCRGITLCDSILAVASSLDANQQLASQTSEFVISCLLDALQAMQDTNVPERLNSIDGSAILTLPNITSATDVGGYPRMCMLMELLSYFQFIKLFMKNLKRTNLSENALLAAFGQLQFQFRSQCLSGATSEVERVILSSATPYTGSVAQGIYGWIDGFVRQLIVIDAVSLMCQSYANLDAQSLMPATFVGNVLDQLPFLSGSFALIAAEWALQAIIFFVGVNGSGESNISLEDLRTLFYLFLNKDESKRSHKANVYSLLNAHFNFFCPRFPISHGPLCWLRAGHEFERDLSEVRSRPLPAFVWKYKICRHLHGQALVAWLSTLMRLDSREAESNLFEGFLLFHLLELAVPECSSWVQLLYSEGIDAAVEVYTALVVNVCKKICSASLEVTKSSGSFGLQMLESAHDRFRIPSDMKKIPQDSSFPPQFFGSAVYLFGAIIDGCEHECVHRNLHATAVTVLLLPSLGLPWRARESVWRRMGENRLLHILEPSKVLQESFSSFFCSPIIANKNEFNAICFALSRLRDDERDLRLRIVQIGLFQIANFIFEKDIQVVEGPRAQLLLHLLQHSPAEFSSAEEVEAHNAGSSFSDAIISSLVSIAVALPKFRYFSDGKSLNSSETLEGFFVPRKFISEDFDSVAMIRTDLSKTRGLFDLLGAHRPFLVQGTSNPLET